jgi:hypothetical protein
LDVVESVNIFSYELGKVLNESVLLTYSYAERFSEATYQDASWIARKIAAFSRKDLEEIIQAGNFPPDVAALVTEKVISRRNHLVEVFNISDS